MNTCFPPHLVVTKCLTNDANCSTRCFTELKVDCLTMASSRTAPICPLNISVMAFIVVVIVAMVAPFVRYEE